MLRGWKEPYCRFPARSQGPGEWEDQGEHSLGLGEYERRELKSDMTGVSFPSRQSPKQQQALYNKSAQHRAAKCSGDRHSAMKKPEQKVLGQPSILSTHHHVCASCVAENGAGVTPRDWTIRGVLHPKYWIRDSMKTSISQDAAGEVTMSEKELCGRGRDGGVLDSLPMAWPPKALGSSHFPQPVLPALYESPFLQYSFFIQTEFIFIP